MEMKDIIEFMKTNKDEEEVKELISELAPKHEPEPITIDTVKTLIGKDESITSWLEGQKDSHAQKFLETWQAENLESLVEEKYRERLAPEELENLAIKELQDKVAQMEAEKNYEIQRNLALKTAQDKGLPSSLIDFFIGSDDEKTLENLSALEAAYQESLATAVKTRLKDDTYVPPRAEAARVYSHEDLGKMSREEINAYFEQELGKK